MATGNAKDSDIGVQTFVGEQITELQSQPSVDTEDGIPASESRQRLYSEDDEEIRMAKAMAMVIHNNPHLKPEEVQKMMEEQFKIAKPVPSTPPTKKPEQSSLLQPLAKSVLGVTNMESENDNKKEWKPPLNPFANIQESMIKTQELAKQRFQEIVQGAKTVETKQVDIANSLVAPAATNGQTVGPIATMAQVKEQNKVTPFATTSFRDSSLPQRAPSVVFAPLQSLTNQRASFLDVDTSQRLESEPVTMSSLVWKRRSGMGKFSGQSWERRRLVLRGNLIVYYKTAIDDGDDSVSDFATDLLQSASSADDEDKKITWLEQAAINLSKANVASTFGIGNQDDDPTKPRGVLDVAKEKARVFASMGHSGAPTPFCLSIKVGADTKWKLCFESHQLQMEWLNVLSNVVVQSCVDVYNTHLLAAADPRSSLKLSTIKETWYPPPRSEGEVGSKLWTIPKYTFRPRIDSRELETFHEDLEEDASDIDGEDLNTTVVDENIERTVKEDTVEHSTTSNLIPDHIDQNTQSYWRLRESDVYIAVAIVNAALLFSHASSTTPNRFWHIATFANLGLYYLLSKHNHADNDSTVPSNDTIQTTMKVSEESQVTSKKVKRVPVPKKETEDEFKAAIPIFKPLAGSTMVKIAEPRDSTVRCGHPFIGWRQIPPERLKIRSHGYKSTKIKVPSPGSLYDIVAVDLFESPKQCLNMAKRVVLPEVTFDKKNCPRTWKSPDVFVISVSFPIEAPASVFAPISEDGRGYTICMYFKLREDTREILRRVTALDYDPSKEKIGDIQKSKINAVRLFDQWCGRAPNDPDFQARFKFIPVIANLKEAGLPSWMHGYMGKPVLIKRKNKTGYLFSHPDVSAMEFDISLHPFPYVAKQAFSYLYNQKVFKNLIVSCGFVVESRDDDELPECLIGCVEICYPNPETVLQSTDLFAGTSPKSNESQKDAKE